MQFGWINWMVLADFILFGVILGGAIVALACVLKGKYEDCRAQP